MHSRRLLFTLLISGILLAGLGRPARGQVTEAFEYDPYRVQLWIAIEPTPSLAIIDASMLAKQLEKRLDGTFGATWQVQGKVAPASLLRRIALQTRAVTAEELVAAEPKLTDDDKCLLVALRTHNDSFQLEAREFDCRSRSWGEPFAQTFSQLDQVVEIAAYAVGQAFAPMVRIELVDGQRAVTRLRAGGLISNEDSLAGIKVGDLLQPVLRRNDRYGKASSGAIQRLPFTFLQVTDRQGYRVECEIQSGVANAIGGRGARTEKLALLVRPQERGTQLNLQSKGKPPAPLVDYEVLRRLPGSKDDPVSLGFTDANGQVQIPLGDHPLQLIYVRHGQQMLARVPIVPGLVEEQNLTLTNDDPRLAAEGYFVAMQYNVMDLVARRELLAARIRARIAKKDFENAQQMLLELRALTGRADLLRQVELQQSQFADGNKGVQSKVDKMFVELRKLLAKHLDPKLIDQVASELNAAKRST